MVRRRETVRDLPADVAGRENYQGALIADVVHGSPAEQAGSRKGDIVKAADGKPIRSAAQLRNLIGLTPLGSRVELRLGRNGNPISAGVGIGPAKAVSQQAGN